MYKSEQIGRGVGGSDSSLLIARDANLFAVMIEVIFQVWKLAICLS